MNRTGRVNLSELLEAIQSKGTSVSMRDVEKAFKSADKDGDLELEFDEFIIMCDNLLRRGKRLFEQKRVSDVLVDIARSHVLLEAFYVAIERTWKHTASHEPRTYAELQRRAARNSNLRRDFHVRFFEWFGHEHTRRASRPRREPSSRPKISRIDFDAIEMEGFEVFAGRGVPPVDFHAGAASASCPRSASTRRRSCRAARSRTRA